MLSDGDEDRLMVRCSVDRGHTVDTSRETSGDVGGDDTADCCTVDTLEEGELGRVQGGSLSERVERLNDDVRVTNDITLSVDPE